MTTDVMEKMLEAKSESWVREHFDALRHGNYILGAVPQMGEELVLLKAEDNSGECFKALNVGRVCAEPVMSSGQGIDGIGYIVACDTFPFEYGSTEKRKTITVALADGIVPNSHR